MIIEILQFVKTDIAADLIYPEHRKYTVNPLKGRDVNWLYFAMQV